MIQFLARFTKNRRGAAVVEFAMIAPVIAGLFLTSFGIWEAATRARTMNSALDAGAAYYMNGGTDDSKAILAIESAWERRPADSSVAINHSCRCQTTPLSCSSLCADQSAPGDYADMQLIAEDPTALTRNELIENRVVRVR